MRGLFERGVFVASASAIAVCTAGLLPTSAAEPQIAAAPAFKARDLVTPPRGNWVTNGGNTFNQRYSPLTQLNRDTV